MATRGRAGWSDKTVTGASRTGSYEVTAARPDVRNSATGSRRQISPKTALASVSTPGQTTSDGATTIFTVSDPVSEGRHGTYAHGHRCRQATAAGHLRRRTRPRTPWSIVARRHRARRVFAR